MLDEPAKGLSPREAAWLHGLLRGFAAQGGTVLVTSSGALEAARIADRVVTIDRGRLIADQDAAAFAGCRLRPRVAVRSPHAGRLAHLLTAEADPVGLSPGGAPVEVVHEGGSRISVYNSSCAAVGELAYRHGILVHRLTEEAADTGPVTPLERADGRYADAADGGPEAHPDLALGRHRGPRRLVRIVRRPATAARAEPRLAVALRTAARGGRADGLDRGGRWLWRSPC
ncbi:hypothetical protein GCM10020000_20600 [Streptomyces olivoverticillatus]